MIQFLKKVYSKYPKIIEDILVERSGFFLLKFFGFLQTIILVRLLSVQDYGTFVVAMSYAFGLSLLLSLGFPATVVRFLSSKDSQSLSKTFSIYVIFSFVLLSLGLISSEKIASIVHLPAVYVVVATIVALFVATNYVFRAIYTALGEFRTLRATYLFEAIVKLVLIVVLALLFDSIGAIIGLLIAYLLLDLYHLKKIRGHGISLKITLKDGIREIVKLGSVFKFALKTSASTIAQSSYQWIDIIIVSYLLSLTNVSMYRVANSIVTVLIPITAFHTIIYNRIKKWREDTRRKLPLFVILNLLWSLTIGFVFYLLMPLLIEKIYGSLYLSAVDLARVLLVYVVLSPLEDFYIGLTIAGKPGYQVIGNLVLNLSNIVLDFVLILRLGVLGAVYATIVSYILYYVIGTISFYLKFEYISKDSS